MAWRRIPPVHSPVRPGGVLGSLLAPSGRGDPTAALRHLLAERFQADEVILCGSGTQALQLALRLAMEVTGREAAVLPAYTCYDIVSAAMGGPATPVFYDIDPDTLGPEPRSMDRALGDEPAAVVAVHQFGLPTVLDPILDQATAAGALVIEDAAQAHGGALNGRVLGSLASISVLSFGRGKGWTGGAGGALLVRGEPAGAARALRDALAGGPRGLGSLARTGAQWLLGRPSLYILPSSSPWLGLGETHYRPPEAPTAMPARVAALVLAGDDASRREAGVRDRNVAGLRDRLADVPALQLPPERGEPGWLRLPVRFPGRDAEDVLSSRHKALGMVRSYPLALPDLPVAGVDRDNARAFPGARTLARELFTVPTHSFLTDSDMDGIAAILRMDARAGG